MTSTRDLSWTRSIRWTLGIHYMLVPMALLFTVGYQALAAAELGDREVIALLDADPPRDKAIRRALAFLRQQQGTSGKFGDTFPVASTSLAVMAHLAGGFTPEDLTHGQALAQGIDYVLTQQNENGYFGDADGSRMYGHGITTLMLAEALGMMRDEEREEAVRIALEKAVALTIGAAQVKKSAAMRGGWRYSPRDQGSDLSLSGWQLMSLHATAQVGIGVPSEVIEGAVEFAQRVTSPDGKVGYEAAGQDHSALRGTALLSFAIGGLSDAPAVARVADRIITNPISWQGPWLFYRAYYDSVGLSRAAPDLWDTYAATLEGVLIDHQAEDGSWPAPPGDNEAGHGVVYRTSMAVLALTVNKHLLPAYQR